MSSAPVQFQWNGEAMVPASRLWARKADEEYIVGETYSLVQYQDRSEASHNHEFARIAELHASIPERFDREPWAQTPEHLRKYALIMCRYCDTQTFTCGSQAEARRWAANLRPMDEYSLVTFEGSTVYRFTAQSQSRRAMGKQRFEESKAAIIAYIEDLVGVERGSSVQVAA